MWWLTDSLTRMERLGLQDPAAVLHHNRFQQYSHVITHVLQKQDNGWEEKCSENEGDNPRGRA